MEHSLSGSQGTLVPTSATPPGGPHVSTGALPKQHTHQQQQPPHHSQQQQPTQYVYNVIPVSERNGYSQPHGHNHNHCHSQDKSTPVVSLLSVGQANERDYRSMQGGRKHRPDKPQDGNTVASATTNGIQSFRMTGQPMSYAYTPINGYQTINKQYRKPCDVNQCRTWSKRRRNYNNAESASVSSVRTSSNSSANAAFDENLNEKKEKMNDNNFNSPPPSSYSPMTVQNHPTSVNETRNIFQPHPNLTTNSYYHQNHASSARKNRKSNPRRNNHHHGHVGSGGVQQQSEIGAGDAPLPDVSDMCKKIDSIKL